MLIVFNKSTVCQCWEKKWVILRRNKQKNAVINVCMLWNRNELRTKSGLGWNDYGRFKWKLRRIPKRDFQKSALLYVHLKREEVLHPNMSAKTTPGPGVNCVLDVNKPQDEHEKINLWDYEQGKGMQGQRGTWQILRDFQFSSSDILQNIICSSHYESLPVILWTCLQACTCVWGFVCVCAPECQESFPLKVAHQAILSTPSFPLLLLLFFSLFPYTGRIITHGLEVSCFYLYLVKENERRGNRDNDMWWSVETGYWPWFAFDMLDIGGLSADTQLAVKHDTGQGQIIKFINGDRGVFLYHIRIHEGATNRSSGPVWLSVCMCVCQRSDS